MIGIVLFINLGALSSQVSKMEGMIYPDVNATVIVDYAPQRIWLFSLAFLARDSWLGFPTTLGAIRKELIVQIKQ